MPSSDTPVTVQADDRIQVSGLLQVPAKASACYILAHGAGAGMTHPFMAEIAAGLAARGIATLRYQFQDADHSFHVPKKSGRTDGEVKTQCVISAQFLKKGSNHNIAARRSAEAAKRLGNRQLRRRAP